METAKYQLHNPIQQNKIVNGLYCWQTDHLILFQHGLTKNKHTIQYVHVTIYTYVHNIECNQLLSQEYYPEEISYVKDMYQ